MNGLTHPSLHRNWIEINLDAVIANVAAFRNLVGETVEILAAVKANAYGHGAVPCARAALAGGATRLGVATCLEGVELREAGIPCPIQILGAALPEEVEDAVEAGLTLSLHELDVARLASLAAVRQHRTASVHLKIDTGMGRLGILPENIVQSAKEIAALPSLELEGVFMHFSSPADLDYSRGQIDRLGVALRQLEQEGVVIPVRHAAGGAAAVFHPESHFDMVRPGLAIYDIPDPVELRERIQLTPALSWRSCVVQVKDYPAGHALGYNGTYTTQRDTRIAVLPVGYADGYMRAFGNRAEVLLHGSRAPVVGMVSMDYALVDATAIPDVNVGSVATLIGEDGNERITAEELAAHVPGVIPYEITTRLGTRPGRVYSSQNPELADIVKQPEF